EAQTIVKAMQVNHVKRLVFVTSLGIYNEVPGAFGEWVKQQISTQLPVYEKAANIIENSGLDYTIFRPAWLTDTNEVDYEITQKDETFKGTEVARTSVAAVAVNITKRPRRHINENNGNKKPNTESDKPQGY